MYKISIEKQLANLGFSTALSNIAPMFLMHFFVQNKAKSFIISQS